MGGREDVSGGGYILYVIDIWKSLLQCMADTSTVQSFDRKLDNLCQNDHTKLYIIFSSPLVWISLSACAPSNLLTSYARAV